MTKLGRIFQLDGTMRVKDIPAKLLWLSNSAQCLRGWVGEDRDVSDRGLGSQ